MPMLPVIKEWVKGRNEGATEGQREHLVPFWRNEDERPVRLSEVEEKSQ